MKSTQELHDERVRYREALNEIAAQAEMALTGGLPQFSKQELAELIAHTARHALGEPVDFSHLPLRVKFRYNDGRVHHVDLAPGHIDVTGKAPARLLYEGTWFVHERARRTIDGRFIYDEDA